MFWEAMAVVVMSCLVIGAVYGGVWCIKSMRKESYRSSSSMAAMGNALQELDRLMARPSVVHQAEVEDHAEQRQNSIDGE